MAEITSGGYILIGDFAVFVLKEEQTVINEELKDYKFYCFNGQPKYCQVISDRSKIETIDFYDMDWKHQEFTGLAFPHKPYSKCVIPKPVTFENMKGLATVMSKEIPFLRVDFYEVNGKMYFGELTFYPASGFGEFEPGIWNEKLGQMLKLPEKRK